MYGALKNTANGYAASSATAELARSSPMVSRASRHRYTAAHANAISDTITPPQSSLAIRRSFGTPGANAPSG